MVHVTKANFLTQLADFLHHLPKSSYVAIDEEMTGISLPGCGGGNDDRPNKVELPAERYVRRLRGVPMRYSILQVGVALFSKNENHRHRPPDDDVAVVGVEGREAVVEAAGGGGGDRLGGIGGPGLGRDVDNDNDDDDDDDDDDGENSNGDDEHAFMHREGMLNQDELEDLTEREEEGEVKNERGDGGVDDDDYDDYDYDDDGMDNVAEGREEQTEYTSRIYNFYLFPHGGGGHSGGVGREITLNPSTVKFLLENHMDFDKVFREGVPYATVEESSYLRKRYLERYNAKAEDDGMNSRAAQATPLGGRERVRLTRPEDIAFVARTMAGLREWIDSDVASNDVAVVPNDDGGIVAGAGAGAGARADANGNNVRDVSVAAIGPRREEGTSIVLPPCNAFLRRCLYETIEIEYPGLILERADMEGGGGGGDGEATATLRNQIRAIRLSPAEKERRESRLRREAWDEVLMEMGFATVFRAISDACNGNTFDEKRTCDFLDGLCTDLSVPSTSSTGRRGIPLIVHNGLHDLMFLLTHCHDPTLPDSFEDTKRIIRSYFPLVFDTKVIGTEFSDAIIKGGSTNLGDLFGVVCGDGKSSDGACLSSSKMLPAVITNQDGRGQGQAHEAAWDAHMTGCVFGALCNRILDSNRILKSKNMTLDNLLHGSPSLLRELFGLNLIYMHVSLFTIDLESSLGPTAGLNDPLSSGLSIDTTFHVSGITTSVLTRDILRALWSGNESEEEAIRQLKYELIWVDDSSFFVGTRMADDGISLAYDLPPTGLIASHVRNKLYAGLGNKVEILSLGDYFTKKNNAIVASDPAGIVGSIVAVASKIQCKINRVLGFGEKRSSDDNCSSRRENKRMRFS